MADFRSVPRSTFALTGLLVSHFVVLVLFGVPLNAQQTNSTWNGGTGNWSNASNWNPADVPNNAPSTFYNVTISVPDSVVAMDVLNATVVNLSLGATDTLSINSGNSLAWLVSASNAGTLINNGTLVNGLAGFGTIDNTGSIVNIGAINSFLGTEINNSGTLTNIGTIGVALGGGFENSGTVNNIGRLFVGIGTSAAAVPQRRLLTDQSV